jgi:hypothetical protein
MKVFSRRSLLMLFLGAGSASAWPRFAVAKDGSGDGGGGSGGDRDSGGDDDSGGADNSGPGSSGKKGSGTAQASGKSITQDEARKAVRTGKALALPLVLAFMANNYPGDVVDVRLRRNGAGYLYEIKYLANSIQLKLVKLDAETLKKL